MPWSTAFAWIHSCAAKFISWNLADGLLIDVYLRLRDDLAASPATHLQKNPGLFGDEGMVYGFDLIDRANRMLVHAFRFQVFYHADEQTLLITRGAHITAQGM